MFCFVHSSEIFTLLSSIGKKEEIFRLESDKCMFL